MIRGRLDGAGERGKDRDPEGGREWDWAKKNEKSGEAEGGGGQGEASQEDETEAERLSSGFGRRCILKRSISSKMHPEALVVERWGHKSASCESRLPSHA
eukprot:4522591-Pleurochrysis_carterae.AAC.1